MPAKPNTGAAAERRGLFPIRSASDARGTEVQTGRNIGDVGRPDARVVGEMLGPGARATMGGDPAGLALPDRGQEAGARWIAGVDRGHAAPDDAADVLDKPCFYAGEQSGGRAAPHASFPCSCAGPRIVWPRRL
jgi:hypothetical protein